MKNILGLEVLHKVPEYRYGKPKSSMREIKNIMREMEYDEDAIENINDDFCQGFGVAREIISDLLWDKYWKGNIKEFEKNTTNREIEKLHR